ncbi:MAG: DUF1638 domain-containing protein [Candidatus Bathyarchaeota archaeon]|nr:MAG: DUF1638 domain-containing protein [Candidatus Bathyarchaeum tardum]WNZ30294.1 MAG: DUF1638 domain-containing protein [Candidatus Bathyarchaeota archaeon]
MTHNNRPLLLSCGILREEIEKLINENKLDVDAVFLDAGLHAVYSELEKAVTNALEEHSKHAKRDIVVIYGDMCHPRLKKIVKNYDNTVKVDSLNCIDCLFGGHKKLLDDDPKCSHFYLSPGWMPSKLKKNKYFKEIFDWNLKDIKEQFKHLDGLIIVDSLGNLDKLESDIKEFSYNSGLEVKKQKSVGLDRLKSVIEEAIKKLQNK